MADRDDLITENKTPGPG